MQWSFTLYVGRIFDQKIHLYSVLYLSNQFCLLMIFIPSCAFSLLFCMFLFYLAKMISFRFYCWSASQKFCLFLFIWEYLLNLAEWSIFLKIFWCKPFLKPLLNLLQYRFCFMFSCFLLFFFFFLQDMWYLSSLTRDQPHPLHWKAKSYALDHQGNLWMLAFLTNNLFLSICCFLFSMISEEKSVFAHIEDPLYRLSCLSITWDFLKKLMFTILPVF